MSDDDAVGYGKPPKETRFKPGRSGNPRGRPKGSKNFNTILAKRLQELVGRPPMSWRRSRIKHYLEQLVDRAIGGDWAAIKEVVAKMKKYDTIEEPVSFPGDSSSFAEVIARIRAERAAKEAEQSGSKFPDRRREFPDNEE